MVPGSDSDRDHLGRKFCLGENKKRIAGQELVRKGESLT